MASAVLGVGALGILGWHLAHGEPRTSEARELTEIADGGATPSGAAVGLHARAVDPAGVPVEWVYEGSDVEPPEDAPPLQAEIHGEDDLEALMGVLQWSLPLGQGGKTGLEMARCAARYEPQLDDRCGWEMTAVLQRLSEDTGRIAYLRVDVTTGAEQAACRALASCSSHAWARREPVPMPGRLGDEIAFSQVGRGSLWHAGMGVDAVEHYRSVAATVRREHDELEAAAHEPTQVTASSLGWNLLFLQHRVDEFECMVDVLEERPRACGT